MAINRPRPDPNFTRAATYATPADRKKMAVMSSPHEVSSTMRNPSDSRAVLGPDHAQALVAITPLPRKMRKTARAHAQRSLSLQNTQYTRDVSTPMNVSSEDLYVHVVRTQREHPPRPTGGVGAAYALIGRGA